MCVFVDLKLFSLPCIISWRRHPNICIALINISYASHVDALDVQCMDVKHVVLEPNHKTMFDGHLQKMEGPAEATEDPVQGRKGPMP